MTLSLSKKVVYILYLVHGSRNHFIKLKIEFRLKLYLFEYAKVSKFSIDMNLV